MHGIIIHIDSSLVRVFMRQIVLLVCIGSARGSVVPAFGPAVGGTRLVIVDTAPQDTLDTNGTLEVGSSCPHLTYSASGEISCTTPHLTATPYSINETLEVKMPCLREFCVSKVVGYFTFRPDPIIQHIEPRDTISSGGINITVSGQDLESVESPMMVVYYQHNNPEITPLKIWENSCEVRLSNSRHVYVCTTLPLHSVLGQSLLDALSSGYLTLGLDLNADLHYTYIRDTLPHFSNLTLYRDPVISKFRTKDHSVLYEVFVTIQGFNLLRGVRKSDYNVTVGPLSASIVEITDKQIVINPPSSYALIVRSGYQETGVDGKLLQVKVHVGSRLKVSVGYINYGVPLSGAAVGNFIISLLIFLVIGTCCFRFCTRYHRTMAYG